MAVKTSKKKPVEKFELCVRGYDSRDADAVQTREVGFTFERVPRTTSYKALFVLRNKATGLSVNLPLPEGNYSKLYELFDGMDPSTVEGYIKHLMTMLRFIPL